MSKRMNGPRWMGLQIVRIERSAGASALEMVHSGTATVLV